MIRIPEYNYRCLTYYQRLFLIEALRKVNINDVSILTAYEYGKSSLAVWRDEPVLVNKFMQTNRAALINFNIERYIEVLNYIAKGLCEVEPDNYNYLPLTPTDVDVLNNAFSNAARWLDNTNNSGINELLDFDVAENDLKYIYENTTEKECYLSCNERLHDEKISKCFRCLIRKGNLNRDKIKELIDRSRASNTVSDSVSVVLKTVLQIISILLRLQYPKDVVPSSAEHMLNLEKLRTPAIAEVSAMPAFDLITKQKRCGQVMPIVDIDIPHQIKNLYFNGDANNCNGSIQRINSVTKELVYIQNEFFNHEKEDC